jgi:hypothetical protein
MASLHRRRGSEYLTIASLVSPQLVLTELSRAAVKNWTANPSPGGLSFSEQVSNFFHGPEHMKCHLNADNNGCTSFVQCHDTNHPAGYFILNSMTALNNVGLPPSPR